MICPANRTLTGDGALLWDTAKFGASSVKFPDDAYDRAVFNSCYDVGNSDFTFELFFYLILILAKFLRFNCQCR